MKEMNCVVVRLLGFGGRKIEGGGYSKKFG